MTSRIHVESALTFLKSHLALSEMLERYDRCRRLYDDASMNLHLESLRKNRLNATTFLVLHGRYTPSEAEAIVDQIVQMWERISVTPWGVLYLEETIRIVQQLSRAFATALDLYEASMKGAAEGKNAANIGTFLQEDKGEGREESPPITQQDGPQPPDKFWWQGRSYDLKPTSCRLLSVLWGHDRIKEDKVIERVWGHDADDKESALKSALNNLNKCLDKALVPWSYGRKQGYITKK